MKTTHLTPLEGPWRSVYPDGEIPWGLLARYCTPLLKAHPAQRVADELMAYLTRTPQEYIDLQKFSSCFGSWTREAKPTTGTGRVYTTPPADDTPHRPLDVARLKGLVR